MKSVVDRVVEFNAPRRAELRTLKYKAMATSAFSFYRGTCHLFYEDLHLEPALQAGPPVWISGDLHMENFGSYRAANGLVYFDINDFDESALAPAGWEIARFLCSVGMAYDLWQYSTAEAESLMQVFIHDYALALQHGKAYAIESQTSPPLIQEFFAMAEQEKEGDLVRERMDKKTERLKLIEGKTLAIGESDRAMVLKSVNDFLHQQYGYLTVHDAMVRIAGTGSLGVARYVLLTRDERKDKWRLLDIKEALPSSLSPYLKMKQPDWKYQAERVYWVQSQVQYALPRFFGPMVLEGRSFLLKQLQPSAQKIDHRLCHKKMKNVETVISTMASALASAHIRSAYRKGSASVEELIEFGTLQSWKEPIIKLASGYAGKMNDYYRQWVDFTMREMKAPRG